MQRRTLLKHSALTVASLGFGSLPATIAAAPSAPAPLVPSGAPGVIPRPRRRRPACLDLAWARGTGLIWMAGENLFYENPRNRFMRFRRRFEVAAPLRQAELRLFADTQYRAWLNGVELGRGPGRSDPTWALFDTYDVTALLRPGTNTLAVLVLFQGYGTGGRQSIMQVLLAHLEMVDAAGQRTTVVSDRSWKASPAEEFVRDTPRLHATLCCAEVQDRRRAEPDWLQPAYDDRAWAPTDYVKPSLDSTPWYHFAPEPLPHRTLTERPLAWSVAPYVGAVPGAPPSVARLGEVRAAVPPPPASAAGSPGGPWLLPGSPPPPRASEAPAAPAPSSAPSLSPAPSTSGLPAVAQVLTGELTRVEAGFLVVDIEGPAGAIVDVLSGEMLVDGRLPRPGAARVHVTRYLLRGGRERLEAAFNWIAFRVVQLWVWSPAPVTVHGLTLRHLELPLGPAGHFACSDPFLNRLDAACEHTLRLCAQDGIVDSSSREQQQWIGDGRYIAITLQHRFAAGVLHRRLIEQVGQGIDWLGSLVPRFPTGNLNVAPIPLYSLQWVLAFRDYEHYTGDQSLVPEWLPLIRHVLRWFTAFERADGLLERVPHWMYIDLGEGSGHGRVPQTGQVNTTLNLHYLAGLQAAADWVRAAEGPATAQAFAEAAERLATALRTALWDEAAGAYRDCLLPNGRLGTLSEGTNAHALLLLEAPGTPRAARILQGVFAAPAVLNPIRASPFMMNAVLAALARHRRADLGLAMLPIRYQDQVATGTMWEHWTRGGREKDGTPTAHSLSHAWGAGALAFFVQAVVGLRPAAPGWAAVRVEPQPGALTHAEGSVMTPRGRVTASWRRAAGRFELHLTLPPEVGGTCRLPHGAEYAVPPGGGRFTEPWP